jgi:hypothetical protein
MPPDRPRDGEDLGPAGQVPSPGQMGRFFELKADAPARSPAGPPQVRRSRRHGRSERRPMMSGDVEGLLCWGIVSRIGPGCDLPGGARTTWDTDDWQGRYAAACGVEDGPGWDDALAASGCTIPLPGSSDMALPIAAVVCPFNQPHLAVPGSISRRQCLTSGRCPRRAPGNEEIPSRNSLGGARSPTRLALACPSAPSANGRAWSPATSTGGAKRWPVAIGRSHRPGPSHPRTR